MSVIVFYVVAVITVVGALGVVLDRNVVRATLSLLVAMRGVAGMFVVA